MDVVFNVEEWILDPSSFLCNPKQCWEESDSWSLGRVVRDAVSLWFHGVTVANFTLPPLMSCLLQNMVGLVRKEYIVIFVGFIIMYEYLGLP